ncbi:major facilitator superfamily domain-containing protein [Lobosporangium transversale]|uniref:Major facilitator superfamily domain-containing protein n=1 Tax=Lobosporangium transversale TaxID=64571 RepID=A0A1Y2GUA2_9FUNG|nr:major facilitator superfamily domain-containing protein [Lobosporangium transversale]ORZ23796.1 major facilitator superfamily domain-containing protein [Lobosporangium transversale]|eukprot:XP_021883610.1 major facilitator superfamily domain-containing protein [Lobosporangium transversale]
MSLSPQTPTPLPKVPLFVLSIVIFSEPLTSTILFPFVYFMVRDFHITESEDEIGFFCGLIASSFFFAQFCTSIFWGFMSDRYGRRPILLIGLCGTAIACTSFGLSKSLPWAIISRSMCGLLNGNVGVAKSMLGEIADKSNQSQAFGVFGFAWGIGMIVGPVLGGYLADPAKNFPEIFGELQFFIEYPYFLPCFVAAIGSLIGFIIGYFFLEETNRRAKTHTHDLMQNNASYTQQPMQVVVIQSGTGLPPVSITTIIAYAMLALHSIVFEEVYTLFAVTPLRSHGLGWSAIQLSGSLASMGLAQLVLQFIIYPQFERRFSAVSIFQFGQLIYGCAYIVFPLIRAFAVDENDGPTAGQTPRVRYLILVALTIKYTCSVFSYTSVMVMVS